MFDTNLTKITAICVISPQQRGKEELCYCTPAVIQHRQHKV